MSNFIVITESVAGVLATSNDVSLNPPFLFPLPERITQHAGQASNPIVLTTSEDKPGCRVAIIDCDQLKQLPTEAAQDTFARIERVIKAIARQPVRLPMSWLEYHYKSLLSFFATPVSYGGYRWVTSLNREEGAVYFIKITDSKTKLDLEKYQVPALSLPRDYIDGLVASAHVDEQQEDGLSFVVRSDFQAIGSGAISRSWNFETWEKHLNDEQKQVLELPSEASIRIVGPAGSGKTLALCIKALEEVRRDNRQGKQSQILFVTHSWAMAENVDDTLTILNSGDPVVGITVMPLLEMFRDALGESQISYINVLGDDSEAGRRLQIEMIASLLKSIPEGDMALLEAQSLSPHIRAALEASAGSPPHMELIENIYLEINGVLLAEGIMPEDRKNEERYLSQVRPDDLPPFASRGDRTLVLLTYKKFLTQLAERGYITTDQLVSDAIKLLETFAWRIRRQTTGYDRIFIDELQYFDAQERFALMLFAASPNTVALISAEDPSQGLFSAISPDWRREVPAHTEGRAITLTGAHRFSVGILEFIKHLYLSFPLNAQAIVVADEQQNIEEHPKLYNIDQAENVFGVVSELVQAARRDMAHQDRLAVICLDGSSQDIAGKLKAAGLGSVVHIASLDDTEQLTHSKHSTVVGEWRYLGGTQFSHVIVVRSMSGTAPSAFARIRDLTALYVASSRASHSLAIVVAGDIPEEVRKASKMGLILLQAEH